MPQQKERIEGARKTLARVRGREAFEEIKRLHLAGQYRTVAQRLAAFPEQDASEQTLAEFKALKSETEAAAEMVADATRYLDELAVKVKGSPEAVLGEAATQIRANVHPDNVHRLETFIGQARQAENQRKQERTVDLTPAQLLSYGVSGWLLGSSASEPRPETALRLWRARQMLMDYLKTDDLNIRHRVLNTYLQELGNYFKEQGETGLLNEMAHLVQQLPPPEAVTITDPAKTLELKAGSRRRPTTYHVRVPPEYRPSRPYPLLIVLHDAGEKAPAMLNRWTEAAAEQGFIVAAPEWEQIPNGTYNFTEEEHAVVLNMLRDLRRRFQVDSDRVFLTGLGQGGSMAYDVGLAHPDLFAGVLPMSAGPRYFSAHYWRNAQYLPFYVLTGDRSGDMNKKIREQFTDWVQRGFPSLWVQYKGRGVEWFGGDIPLMFDWMRNKKRVFPLHQLGTESNGGPVGTEFQTMRAGDNHFYWLSTDAINERCLNSVVGWKNTVTPATLTARINPTTNEVNIRASGLKQLTVWFGRDAKGTPMIDFDKPVLIRVGLETKWNKKVEPSLTTMLEDLYQRGDRQQLFLAKVPLDLRR
jgi:predicted esterase